MYTIPYTQAEDIAHRAHMHQLAQQFPLTLDPDAIVHTVGDEDGTVYKMVHAADMILADRKGRFLLIRRSFPPGEKKLAPAGEMLEINADGSVETTLQAAYRGALEEMNVVLPETVSMHLVRPRTIAEKAIRRVAPIPEFMAKYDMKEGDYCSVTTAFYCAVVDDIDHYDYKPSSDARSLQFVQFNPNTGRLHLDNVAGAMVGPDDFAIADLYSAVMTARAVLATVEPAFADIVPPAGAGPAGEGNGGRQGRIPLNFP
jgi:hypothetical protein